MGLRERVIYDELLVKKQKDEKLNWESVTREQLYQMWGEELITDNQIADLFDVSKSKVLTKRRNWNINEQALTSNKWQTKFDEAPSFRTNFSPNMHTEIAEKLVDELSELSQQEQYYVILSLISSGGMLEQMYELASIGWCTQWAANHFNDKE